MNIDAGRQTDSFDAGAFRFRFAPIWTRLTVIALSAVLFGGCAHHEPGRYQIKNIQLKGQTDFKERPVLSCLISRQRPRFNVTLGMGDPQCGKRPFSRQAPRLNLWSWWWSDWPELNLAVFDQDLERVLRWYRARGYYDAHIVKTEFTPKQAADPTAPAPCDLENDICEVTIVVSIEEGDPTLVRRILWVGLEELPGRLQKELKALNTLVPNAPIDEADYDFSKKQMFKRLRDAGYAKPRVSGRVEINTIQRRADIEYVIESGPVYQFGKLILEGNGPLPAKPIKAAADLPTGDQFSPDVINDVQREVYALGAFSSVQLYEEYDEKNHLVDVRMDVSPRPTNALRIGIGLLSGAEQRTATGELRSIPQWDIHLFGRYERRHVFGTLGKLKIEERPRMIFDREFPVFTQPNFGNIISMRLNQPGLIEKRTDLINDIAWDYGPDPFLGFFRSDIYGRVSLRRGFFSRTLIATMAVQQDFFIVNANRNNQTSDGSELPSSYAYTFFEQDLRLDLRDNAARPRRGIYLGLNVTEAPKWAASDWIAFRLAPEVRTYVPLFWDIVWACRFAIAALFITDASADLDDLSARLGPTSYRLRGGGANGNRGFLPGKLGVGLQGGIRRWEASTELRIPLGRSFVLAGFLDAGDVNDQKPFRFSHLNLTAGWGFRYHTLFGVIRLDVGLRIKSLQRTDGSDGIEPGAGTLFGVPGAIHLTIGDAF